MNERIPVIDDVRRAAEAERANAIRLGKRNQRVHFAIGIGTIVAGAVAGTAGLAEAAPLLVGVAGFTAASCGGLSAWLRGEERTNYAWKQGAAYAYVAHKAALYLERESGPTEAETDQLAAELRQIRANVRV